MRRDQRTPNQLSAHPTTDEEQKRQQSITGRPDISVEFAHDLEDCLAVQIKENGNLLFDLESLRLSIDKLSLRSGFPIVQDLHQVLVTIGNRMDRLRSELAEVTKERDRLAEWKRSMMQVESEWDEQKLAKLLGGKIGQSTRKTINEEVPKVLAERENLRDILNQVLSDLTGLTNKAEVYGMAGATNHPAVRCEVKGLTLGDFYKIHSTIALIKDTMKTNEH
jgi:hypothetical protein